MLYESIYFFKLTSLIRSTSFKARIFHSFKSVIFPDSFSQTLSVQVVQLIVAVELVLIVLNLALVIVLLVLGQVLSHVLSHMLCVLMGMSRSLTFFVEVHIVHVLFGHR